MLYFYLLFAHLLSDYILQPDNLVEWKNRSPWGLLVHSLIHFLCANLLLFLYTGQWQVVFLALLAALFHFVIDGAKAAHDQGGKGGKLSYWLDQLAHYLSILLITLLAWRMDGAFAQRAWLFDNPLDQLYFNPVAITFACLAIFITLTVEYSHYQNRLRNGHPPLNLKNMIRRLFLASIVYFGLLFAIAPGVGVYFGS
jgi:hypothetical protein